MTCRACGAAIEAVVLLGDQPVGGGFPHPGDPDDERQPLRLGMCVGCGLAQLADASPPEAEDPLGPSPLSSATMMAHGRRFVDDLLERRLVGPSSRIVTVGSHGGNLAPMLAERGLPATILDDSPDRAARLRADATTVVEGRLDGVVPPADLAPRSLDLVVDSFLLAHLERPRLALRHLSGLLAPGGTLAIEFDHLLPTVEGGQWDAVRHGHPLYLSLGWLARELEAVGLFAIDAVPQPVYGGALRVYARAGASRGSAVDQVAARESASGLDRPAGLLPLQAAVELARREVPNHLREVRAGGRLAVGYGAPSRSITFLNALGIGPDLLPYIVDRAPSKQGRTIPGGRIPIRDPEALRRDPPDEVLILTWDLAAEVIRSLDLPALAATRFFIAVPRLTELSGTDGDRGRSPAPRGVR